MRRTSVRLAQTLILLAACVGLLACGQADRPPSAPPDRIALACVTPPFSTLVDIAAANGYFRHQGLDVTFRYHSNGRDALDDVLAGRADFAAAGGTPLMFAILKGNRICIIATIQSSSKTNAVIVRRDRGITIPEDLRGRRIGVTLGTTGDYFLDSFLALHGMARANVKLTNVTPEQVPGALSRGEIDAASTWPPYLERAEELLGPRGLTFYEEDIYTQTTNLAAIRDQVRRNPARVKRILRALLEAAAFVRRKPEESPKIVADFRHVDRAVLMQGWKDNRFRISLDQMLLISLEDEARWAILNRLTNAEKIPNFLDDIYFDGLREVDPRAVRILR